MGPWLGFIRPFPLLFLWTSVLVGAVVDADLLATSLDSFHLFEVLLLVALLWFNSVMLNDYFDREEDSVNEGDRPLNRIGLKPFRTVYVMSTILLLAGSFSVGKPFGLLMSLSFLIGFFYSAPPVRLKERSTYFNPGIAFLSSSAFFAGAVYDGVFSPETLKYALLLGFPSGVLSLVKDLKDYQGDSLAGRKTVATKYGPEKAVSYILTGTLLAMTITLLIINYLLSPLLVMVYAYNIAIFMPYFKEHSRRAAVILYRRSFINLYLLLVGMVTDVLGAIPWTS